MSDATLPLSPLNARPGDRTQRGRVFLLVLLGLTAFVAALGLGAGAMGPRALFMALQADASATDSIVLLNIRLPRLFMGALVGAGLAVSGAIMQGLFRNPLADPGLVGVSAGAGLGAVGVIVLGASFLSPLISLFGPFALPVAAFLGGLAVTAILYRVSTRAGQTAIATMLLAGIALSAMAGAATGVLVFVADDAQLRDLTFWQLGSLSGATWVKVMAIAPIIAPGLLAAPLLAHGLNALTLGEGTARHMGVRVERLKKLAIVMVAAMTGAAVAVSGGIGFVGIVVPHLLRLAIGPDNRFLLPGSALLGAVFILLADMAARTIVAPAELPIGIITAAVGGPFFLWLLLRRGSAGNMAW